MPVIGVRETTMASKLARAARATLLAGACALATACGGGGSSSGTPPTPAPAPAPSPPSPRADGQRSRPLSDAGELRTDRCRHRPRPGAGHRQLDRRAVRVATGGPPDLRAGELRPAAVRCQFQLHAGRVLAAGDSRARPAAAAREIRAVADRRGVGRERHHRQRRERARQLRGSPRPARVRQLSRPARGRRAPSQ